MALCFHIPLLCHWLYQSQSNNIDCNQKSISPTSYEQLLFQLPPPKNRNKNWKHRKVTLLTFVQKATCKMLVKLTPALTNLVIPSWSIVTVRQILFSIKYQCQLTGKLAKQNNKEKTHQLSWWLYKHFLSWRSSDSNNLEIRGFWVPASFCLNSRLIHLFVKITIS